MRWDTMGLEPWSPRTKARYRERVTGSWDRDRRVCGVGLTVGEWIGM